MRPEIGARMMVRSRSIWAERSAAAWACDVGARFARCRHRILVQLARDEVALHQLGIAADLALGARWSRRGPGERRARAGYARFVARRIDPVERLAGADVIAFGEQPRANDPVDLRADIRSLVGRSAARQLGVSVTGCSATTITPTGVGGGAGWGCGLRLARRK